MVAKTHDFEVSLRLGRLGKHTVTLAAPNIVEAKRRATQDAVATSGGDFADWSITSCDKLDAPAVRQAA